MSSSTHKVEVFRIDRIYEHPDADALEIVKPWGYQCVVRKGEWKEGDLAAYVPPDSLVPLDVVEFAWLKDLGRTSKSIDGRLYHRVTAIRLRKEPSLGVVVPIWRVGGAVGDDVGPALGVIHYDPPSKEPKEKERKPWWTKKFRPNVRVPIYDLESLRRYSSLFEEGEPVVVTEKIHGANFRAVWDDTKWIVLTRDGLRVGPIAMKWGGFGRGLSLVPSHERYLWVGSRTQWRLKDHSDWWKVIDKYPQVVDFLRAYPEVALYGEVYGDVQDLRYGRGPGEIDFAAFDILAEDGFVDAMLLPELLYPFDIPIAPIIGIVPFNMESVLSLAEGPSVVKGANHLREGVVVKPVEERHHPAVGRVALKVVSVAYLERQK